jgi:hypothetical protein
LSPRLTVHKLGEYEELATFRLVGVCDPTDPRLIESFRSNAELGRPPKGRAVRHPEIHRGVSVFKARGQAIERRRRIVERLLREGEERNLRIGDFVAELRLSGPAVRFEDRGLADGHMTIWADAHSLVDMVVKIAPATPTRSEATD